MRTPMMRHSPFDEQHKIQAVPGVDRGLLLAKQAGSGQCFPVRGLFSGAISQGQSYVINLNGAGRHRCLVQREIVVNGPPPEEPTDRKALSVATPARPGDTRNLFTCDHVRRQWRRERKSMDGGEESRTHRTAPRYAGLRRQFGTSSQWGGRRRRTLGIVD